MIVVQKEVRLVKRQDSRCSRVRWSVHWFPVHWLAVHEDVLGKLHSNVGSFRKMRLEQHKRARKFLGWGRISSLTKLTLLVGVLVGMLVGYALT